MKKKLNIALLGAILNNPNMGCLALTYSVIDMLEHISKEINVPFNYYISEYAKDIEKIQTLCEKLHISETKIKSVNMDFYRSFLSKVKHSIKLTKGYFILKNRIDLVIDLTQGDSFTTIYGQERFDNFTKLKLFVEKLGIPLILGPQTYGPFNNSSINVAKKAIEQADLVIARDQKSFEYLRTFTNKEVHVVTDLAFSLPYEKFFKETKGKIKIGFNCSGLLTSNNTDGTDLKIPLTVDYDKYSIELVRALLNNKCYELYIIPHVKQDGMDILKPVFPEESFHNIHYLDVFTNPISAKNEISKMDVFIGARMHATIGAFSTGVATIPTAYSRKFSGLYESLNYPYTIDLTSLSTEEALSLTLRYIKEYKILREAVKNSSINFISKTDFTYKLFKDFITNLIG
jgi:polysaccharide pyruvyl transferase WcaK-like protein